MCSPTSDRMIATAQQILAGVVRAALPLIERADVATAREVDADTLQQRIGDELATAGAVFAHPIVIGAWGTDGEEN